VGQVRPRARHVAAERRDVHVDEPVSAVVDVLSKTSATSATPWIFNSDH
jgi:hypothetical protein